MLKQYQTEMNCTSTLHVCQYLLWKLWNNLNFFKDQKTAGSDLSLLLSIFFFFSYNFTIMGKLIRQDIIMLKSISPVSNPRSVQTISIIIRHSFVIECLFSVLDAERKLFMITWNFVWTNLFVNFAWIQQFFLKMC